MSISYYRLVFVFIIASILYDDIYGQMIEQCLCNQFEPCRASMMNNLMPCLTNCESQLNRFNINFADFRKCFVDRESQISALKYCVESNIGQICTTSPGQSVPKRYIETLKFAVVRELNTMFGNRKNEMFGAIRTVEKFAECTKQCVERQTNYCFQTLNCGLNLPTDSSMVALAKSCSIQSGFDTLGIRQLCQCLAVAGVK